MIMISTYTWCVIAFCLAICITSAFTVYRIITQKTPRNTGLVPYNNTCVMSHVWDAWAHDYHIMSQHMTFIGNLILRNDFNSMIHNHKMISQLQTKPLSLPVVVILGMPRTGTTMLQHWIAENDTSAMWIPYSQQSEPFSKHPKLTSIISDIKLRIVKRLFAPDLDTKHYVSANGPDEEILLMNKLCGYPDNRMLWLLGTQAYFDMATNEDDNVHAYHAYELMKRYMSHIEVPSHKRYWLLKSPVHLYPNNIKALRHVFPDANYIMTYRDNHDAILGSYASMNETVQKIFYGEDNVNPQNIKPYVVRHLKECWQGWCHAVQHIPKHKSISYAMHVATRKPRYALSNALHKFEIPEYVPPPKHGQHVYDLNRYGMNEHTKYEYLGGIRDMSS